MTSHGYGAWDSVFRFSSVWAKVQGASATLIVFRDRRSYGAVNGLFQKLVQLLELVKVLVDVVLVHLWEGI